MNATKTSAIKIDPGILGGTPCFSGTRVPVRILFEHLASGYSTLDFLGQFPTVSREQVEQVLEMAQKLVIEPVAVAS